MHTKTPLSLLAMGTLFAATAFAQTPSGPAAPSAAMPTGPAPSSEMFAPRAGDREFTLGGSGLSNKDMDSSSGGIGFSIGRYLSDTWLFSIRQSVNYVNPDNAGSSWIGSTRAAFDFHIPTTSRLRPFVGAHLGGIYGGGVSDTFAAGLEAGLKYHVRPQTFLYLMADYAWAFEDSDDIDDTFDDGGYQWNVGIGFNF